MRLSIELVPSTCWYSNVRSNVTDETWTRLQRITFEHASHACEICGGRGTKHPVEAHETWAYDDHRMIQRLTGLIGLCPRCHEVKHIGLAIARGRSEPAMTWLAAVNQISANHALAYVQRALQIHEIRSRFQWQLDVSILETRYRVNLRSNGLEIGLDARHGK